ncbi:MAG: hypothetical protein ACQEQL_07525, partial [Pseudomonadota bacterium]
AKACENINIHKLSPRKTVALALDLTRRHTLSQKMGRQLKQDFAAVAGDFRKGKKLDGQRLRKITKTAENTNCPLTRKTISAYFDFIQMTLPVTIGDAFNFKVAQKRINPPQSKRKPSKNNAARRHK